MKVIVKRGSHLESAHEISWVLMDHQQKVIESQGNLQESVFPRSAIKMIQLLPLQRLKRSQGLSSRPEELACGCASHSGQACHVDVVSTWLRRLNLAEQNLVCGAHLPFDKIAAKELIQKNLTPSRIHNNCSGKHAGLLELARFLNSPVENYYDINHPVQKALRSEMEFLADCKLSDEDWGVDGCGIPAWRMPLLNIAKMVSRFSEQAASIGTVEEEIFQACVKFPILTSGEEEFCGLAMRKLPGEVFLKVGAEGVMVAILPKRKSILVLKVKDGAERAAEVAVSSLLVRAFPEMAAALSAWTAPTLYNWAGTPVGTIESIY